MPKNQLEIPILDDVSLQVYPVGEAKPSDEQETTDEVGSRWQLEEGKEYEYEFVGPSPDRLVGWYLDGPDALIQRNPHHISRGRIVTGVYVGTAQFRAVNEKSKEDVPVLIEIQSFKIKYDEHYKRMMSDITSYYTELVMQQGSPVSQQFEVNHDASPKALYQKFAFVKSIIEDEQFEEAMQMITYNPIRKWTETVAERRMESVKRLTRKCVQQIATRTDRVPYKGSNPKLTSLPRYLSVTQKIDTIDNPENQFVKFVLTSFYGYCTNLSSKDKAGEVLRAEIDSVCNILAGYLNTPFFKDISDPTHLNIGSPVLQRKEGYREILQAWLKFDLAARLNWTGGDDVYYAGQKNIATLYEYWVFFKLLKCVSDVFQIDPEENRKLIKEGEDEIDLNLRQGITTMICGSTVVKNRRLNVNMYYNRIFRYSDKEHMGSPGSWTMTMRPDYTLSIWPGELTDDEAEKKDVIVHIHFDAKYRLNRIIIEDKGRDDKEVEEELQDDKKAREVNIYKRGDLLKMHAYKDAIRRTAGAYVIYPGEKKEITKGFHEIIPGLGAFPLIPGEEETQLSYLKDFLKAIVDHFTNRISQREKIALNDHQVHTRPVSSFEEKFPEPYDYPLFPDAVSVLLGSFKDKAHLDWILTNKKYAAQCTVAKDGTIKLEDSLLQAKYLLLYAPRSSRVKFIMKMTTTHPAIVSDKSLTKMGYPIVKSGNMYFLYEVSIEEVEDELKERPWGIKDLIKGKKGVPQAVLYTNLFNA